MNSLPNKNDHPPLAAACGYSATTGPHGAKSAANADWSVFRGREVVIIPDRGKAGSAYARVLLSKCFDASASSVRLLDLLTSRSKMHTLGGAADV